MSRLVKALSLVVLTAVLAGCGASTSARLGAVGKSSGGVGLSQVRRSVLGRLSPARRALVISVARSIRRELRRPDETVPADRVHGTVRRVPAVVSGSQVQPSVAGLVRAAARSRGSLSRSFQVRLLGGLRLSPTGQRDGSGRVRVSLFTGSVVCWRFEELAGLNRPDAVELSRVVGTGSGVVRIVPFLPLGTYRRSGCAQGASRFPLMVVARDPGEFVFGVGDVGDAVAVGGVL